jgi:antitoxin component YwqK of YwqJK toxin-antitoxin module
MSNTKRYLEEVLMEMYPDGIFNEEEFWEAVAEADGYEKEYYADGDIAEWL